MLSRYRGVWIIVLRDSCWSAELTDAATGDLLPTKVLASLEEGPGICLERARNVVDLYAAGRMHVRQTEREARERRT